MPMADAKCERIVSDRKRQWLVALSLALAGFMIRLDIYIVNVSLPSICRYFCVDSGVVAYVMMAYMLVITSTLLLFGKLADRVGLKRILVLGYTVFITGSALCGFAVSISMLIACRCVQGLGAAMLFTSSFAMISRVLPGERTGWAYGMWTTAVALGITAGSPLGGLISGFASWHWVFLINVPVGVAAISLVVRVIPGDRAESRGTDPSAKRRYFDVPGAFLSLAGLSVLVYSLNIGHERGWSSVTVLGGFALAAVLLSALFFWERKCPDPIIPTDIMKSRGFIFAILTGAIGFILVSGNSFLLPFYLELSRGLKPQSTGMLLLLYSLSLMLVSPSAGRASDRIDPRRLGFLAMNLLLLGFLGFALTLRFASLIPVTVFLVWLGVSCGLFFSPNNHLAMSMAPPEQRGAAAGIYQTGVNLGVVLGVCLFETAFSSSAGSVGAALELTAPINRAGLLAGFRNAYLLGAALCLLAMFLFGVSSRAQARSGR